MTRPAPSRHKCSATPGGSIVIDGVDALHPTTFEVIPDRIECGTFIAAAAITRGDITIERCDPDVMTAVFDKLDEMRIGWERRDAHTLRVWADRAPRCVDITTLPYPGFPTDLQSPFMSVLCTAEGHAIVEEKIYPERFMHVAELSRMGAKLYRQGPTVMVIGGTPLRGAPVMASDLRASASMVLAGLAAEGETIVSRIYHLDRGYTKMEETLNLLGANIERFRPEADEAKRIAEAMAGAE